MAWWSFLTTSKDTITTAARAGETIVNGVVSGLDVLVLTPEEKIQYNLKKSDLILKFWDSIAKENTEQSKARRELARMTFQVFFFFLLAAGVTYGFDEKLAGFLLKLAGTITFLVSAIGIIYFGPHQIQKIIKK